MVFIRHQSVIAGLQTAPGALYHAATLQGPSAQVIQAVHLFGGIQLYEIEMS